MIKYKMTDSPNPVWKVIKESVQPTDLWFSGYEIKIGDRIFTENNKEFKEAFEAERFWDKLKK